jgi:hypothetical protein
MINGMFVKVDVMQVGALNAIEGEHGLLRMFGTVSNYDSILEAIGENWVCKDTAIKVIEGFCLILQTIIH